jgi:hypothetical protein
VVEARIDDERLGGAVAECVELRPLVPAFVDEDEDAAAREEQSVDRLREVGDLIELAALGREGEQLPGPRKVGRDQQLRAVGRPRERKRLAELEELAKAGQ